MKVKLLIPKIICRRCPYNDFKNTGVDFCVRAKCIYNVLEEKEGSKVEEGK